MQKIVINTCYGGFGLSYDGVMLYAKYAGIDLRAHVYAFSNGCRDLNKPVEYDPKIHSQYDICYSIISTNDGCTQPNRRFYVSAINRDDPILVRVVEELGESASGTYAELKVVEIPDDVEWYVDDIRDTGIEYVDEVHRSWD
jgi:hypothetical protein